MREDVKSIVAEVMERHKGLLEALARGVDPWPYCVIPDEKLAFERITREPTIEEIKHIYG